MYETEYALLGGDKKQMRTTEDTLRVIREGLPIKMVEAAVKALEVSKNELVPLIGLNLRSYQRKKNAGHLTAQQSEHTLAMMSVLTNATEYFGTREVALKWLKTPQMIFSNQEAIDYLDTMTGIDFVNDVINRMKYGMTA